MSRAFLLLSLMACRNDAITWAHAVLGPAAECRAMHTSDGAVQDVDTAICTYKGQPWYCEYGDSPHDPHNCRVVRNTYGLAENDEK